jgi:hypothetical protein
MIINAAKSKFVLEIFNYSTLPQLNEWAARNPQSHSYGIQTYGANKDVVNRSMGKTPRTVQLGQTKSSRWCLLDESGKLSR